MSEEALLASTRVLLTRPDDTRDMLRNVDAAGVFVSLSALSSRDNDFRPFSLTPAVVFMAALEEEGRELICSGLVDTSVGLDSRSLTTPALGEVSSDEDISLHCTVLSLSMEEEEEELETERLSMAEEGAGAGPPRLTRVESLRRPVAPLKGLLAGWLSTDGCW